MITHDQSTVKRRNKMGQKEDVGCPKCIADYNTYMGGVDKFDSYMAVYNISWKSRRWRVKIFYFLLESAIVNSYTLYKTSVEEKEGKGKAMSHLNFRSALADELKHEYSNNIRCKRGRPAKGVMVTKRTKDYS